MTERAIATRSGSGGIAARDAQRRSATARRRNNQMRKAALRMLQTPIDATPEMLEMLHRLGMATDRPELQAVLLGRLASIALGADCQLAMRAINMLMQIAGVDERTIAREADREIRQSMLVLRQDRHYRLYCADSTAALDRIDALIASIDGVAAATSEDAALIETSTVSETPEATEGPGN